MTRWREIGVLAGGVAVFSLLCWRFGLSPFAAALAQVRPVLLAGYFGLAVLVLCGYTARWFAISRLLGGRSPFARLLAARLAGDAVGSLLPGAKIGGDPVRVALVADDGTDGPRASAAVAIDRTLELLGNTLVVISYVTAFTIVSTSDASRRTAFVLLAVMAVLLASLVALLVLLRKGRRPLSAPFEARAKARGGRLARWIALARETEDHIISFFQRDPRVFAGGLALTLVIELTIIAEYYVLLAAFGVHLPLATVLMATVMSGLAHALPTPAGIGAMEGAQVTLFAIAAGKPELGFVVGMILRLHETFWIGLGMAVIVARGLTWNRLLRVTTS